MSAPPYMKLFWGDYFRDTRCLNRLEHSAYLLLLGEMWVQGGRLPDDDAKLAKFALCTPQEWTEISPTVRAFFSARRGWMTQKRLTAEMEKYRDKVCKLKTAGRAGSIVTNAKRKVSGAANAATFADITRTRTREEKETPFGVKERSQTALPLDGPQAPPAAGPGPRGSRLPVDWAPSEIEVAYAVAKGFDRRAVDHHAERFRNYWSAQPGKGGVKLDWPATWRNWVLREAERLAPKAPARRQDWI